MDLSFQEKICFVFNSPDLLRRALTHSSYANESGCADNEVLEFLGDSLIGFVVSEYLINRFPEKTEGELSVFKSALVSSGFLSRIARVLDIGSHLFLGKGEERTGGRERLSILAGAFEAVAAAVYLDGGKEKAGDFILGHIAPEAERLNGDERKGRHKGVLQEYAQTEYARLPDYAVVDESGRDHEKKFTVRVSIAGKTLGCGEGRSKKDAESKAAENALERLGSGKDL